MDDEKTCSKCGVTKSLTEFYNHVRSKTGKTTVCKVCTDTYTRSYYGKNKTEVDKRNRWSSLKRLYGLSVEQYEKMYNDQDGRCAICERHESEFPRRFAVDHNHETGRIRGLLCTYCNHRVVGRHKDGDLLRRIADYIEQGTDWFVPKKKRPVKRKPRK